MERRVWTFSPTDNRFHTHGFLFRTKKTEKKKKHRTLLTDTFAINNNILMVSKAKAFSGVQGCGRERDRKKKKSVLETIVM
jgi:hypothetical protein